MISNGRILLPFICSILLLQTTKTTAYGGICDEPNAYIYCSCNTRSGDTSVACFINSPNLHSNDEAWRSLGQVEKAVSLKLLSVLPSRLNYIPTESLNALTSLRILTFEQANLNELQTNALHGLNELRELDLKGCDITSLQPHAISNLPKLKKMFLSENLLQEVLAESMTELLELEELFLDRNNISRVEACAFCDLQNLKDLGLSGNQITDLTDYMFRGLRYLKRLDLYKNKIRILNDKIFHSMPKLVEIDLKDNLISHIAPHAFEGLDKLQRLWLNSNKIKLLPDQVFKPMPHLRSLYLYNNELETLQEEVLKNMAQFKDEHFSVAFKVNPLVCDCRLSWVKNYMKHNRSHLMTWELKDLQCRPEGENQTLQTVRLMKMDCDKKAKPKSVATTSRSVTQSVNFVPYEIHERPSKNKTSADTVTDDEYLNQDGESQEKLEEKSEAEPLPPSGSRALSGNVHLTLCVAMLTLFLVRKRKGTLA